MGAVEMESGCRETQSWPSILQVGSPGPYDFVVCVRSLPSKESPEAGGAGL